MVNELSELIKKYRIMSKRVRGHAVHLREQVRAGVYGVVADNLEEVIRAARNEAQLNDPEKQKHLDWINRYLVEENFPAEHLIAISHIVGLFNDSTEAEAEIFNFSKRLYAKYAA